MRHLKNYDFTLMITPILLAAFGVVMIYSASMVTAVVAGLESTYFMYKQLQWFFISIIAFTICSLFPYKLYQKVMKVIILLCVILLVAVLLFGKSVHNSTRAIVLFGSTSVQPAEFVKLGLILYLSSIYSKKQSYINDFFKGVLPPLILTAFILGLIILQPDIGTSAIILLIACSIIFSSGIRFKHLLILISAGIVVLAVAIPNMVTKVRIDRFTGAYQPFADPADSGYHLIQSYLAIGAGGVSGEGLGQSIQKLGYLWGAYTDFIMSVIAEELGLIGVVVVIGLIALIVLRGIYIGRRCKDSFGALLAIGISSMVGIQALINLGSISGILPITGVPLPFISYGGSSLLVLMASMGILNNVAMSVKQNEGEPARVDHQDLNKSHKFERLGGRKWSS